MNSQDEIIHKNRSIDCENIQIGDCENNNNFLKDDLETLIESFSHKQRINTIESNSTEAQRVKNKF